MRSKSNSRSNPLPIQMVGNNEITQVMKMLEGIYTRMDESKKKMEPMTTTIQTLIEEEDGKPHNKEGEDVGKGEVDDKRREEEGQEDFS